MKRIIISLIALMIGVASIYAQATYDSRVVNGYGYYTGVAGDTIVGSGTADAVFFIGKDVTRYTLAYMVDIDTNSGGTGDPMTIQPQGSYDGTTYTNIGSAITYYASVDTAFNANASNTYTEVNASHTETLAAATGYVNGTWDTVGTYYQKDDTLTLPQRVVTVAQQTVTVTVPGVDYRYIKILITGAGAADAELQLAAIKVTPIGKLD